MWNLKKMKFYENYDKKKNEKIMEHMFVKCVSLSSLPKFGELEKKNINKSCIKNCLNCLNSYIADE